MKSIISICILLCLTILASGMASAQGEYPTSVPAADQSASLASGLATGQASPLAACPQYGQAAAEGTYGTKVTAGDQDVALPLSAFVAIGGGFGTVTAQNTAYVSFWDIGSTPGLFDNQDVIYLQFGSSPAGAERIVRGNNIRLTGWGNYPAGSYVKPGDSDIGQQLLPWGIGATFRVVPPISFAYMEVDGGQGYGLADPVYLDIGTLPITDTNDVRITSSSGFPPGSRVSNADPDAVRPLLAFFGPFPPINAGPLATGPAATPIAQLAFFNANGNALPIGPIYDDGDTVYFDVTPLNVVSPNDIRLY